MKKNVLAMNVNRNYTDQINVFLYSLFRNGNVLEVDFDIHIFTRDIRMEDIKVDIGERELTITKVTENDFDYLDDSEVKSELCYHDHLKSSTLRIYAMEVLKKSYEHMLYIDVDVLIVDDVTELFKSLDDDVDVMAAMEGWIYAKMSKLPVLKHYENNENYFNAGVMKVNLKNIHRYGNLVSKFRKTKMQTYLDQDFLNSTFDNDKVRPLGYEYNAMFLVGMEWLNLESLHSKLYNKGKVLHYAGIVKPWVDYEMLLQEYENNELGYPRKYLFFRMSFYNIRVYYKTCVEIKDILSKDFLGNIKKNIRLIDGVK